MESLEHAFHALGGPCHLKLYGSNSARLKAVCQSAVARLAEFEAKYSRYRPDSVVSRINKAAGSGTSVTVDVETSALLEYAYVCHQQSNGLFDITSGVLRRVWDFQSGKLPSQQAIDKVLPLIGLDKLQWQAPQITLPLPGMELDFGGFGKEHAADLLTNLCRQQGIAHGLVDLGGDLSVIGPHPQHGAWPVGIRNPSQPDKAIARIDLPAGGLASSGNYERHMDIDNTRYSHILDPTSGWPVTTAAGITVIADTCLVAGTLATIAMLKGEKHSAAWLAELEVPHLVIKRDGRIEGSLAGKI